MAAHGETIEPCQVILSGSFVRPVVCPPGSEICADLGGFGRVDLKFAKD
jgi:2-oxo-hept-3-ene-1,7-dioate hydratase